MARKLGRPQRSLRALALLPLVLLLAGCSGESEYAGFVIYKNPPNELTIAWCRERAKLSDYVINATFEVSLSKYEDAVVGSYVVLKNPVLVDEQHRVSGC